MNPIVHSIELQQFRSISDQTIWFDNPTFLVGRNGSGKSNLLDALAFLSEIPTTPLTAVFDKRGGIEAVRRRASMRAVLQTWSCKFISERSRRGSQSFVRVRGTSGAWLGIPGCAGIL